MRVLKRAKEKDEARQKKRRKRKKKKKLVLLSIYLSIYLRVTTLHKVYLRSDQISFRPVQSNPVQSSPVQKHHRNGYEEQSREVWCGVEWKREGVEGVISSVADILSRVEFVRRE